MVTRNQHDGASSSGWWDDLPSAIKKRVQRPETSEAPAPRPSEEPAPYRPAVVYDLSRLAILFLAVAVANLLFLLIALSFLSGHDPLGH
ncbi:MAG: hypothetical protein C0467_12930 [Planctomycetaceae bacterium]|nr:hypothetical protein [Planctomycetaceae bacterium]